MLLKDLFIREDKRRDRRRPTLLAWIAISVLGLLVTGAIVASVRGLWTSGPAESMRPIATSTAQSETPAVTQAPTPTPVGGCPENPSEWRMVSYELPASDRTLYRIVPPCVMEEVEAAYAVYLDQRAAKGRHWTERDRYIAESAYTAPLSGETIEAVEIEAYNRGVSYCIEERGSDGAVKTSEDYHIVFYTVSQGGTADVLVVAKGEPGTTYVYECGTDDLVQEVSSDGKIGVVYWPMIYEDSRWLRGRKPDVVRQVSLDDIDPEAMVDTILRAQGRR
jgi:hypothetical protein